MSTKVSYVGKDGLLTSLVFGAPGPAQAYAKTVKDARIEEVPTEAPPVEVTRCPDGTPEALQDAPVRLRRRGSSLFHG